MVTSVHSGQKALERMTVYRRLAAFGPLRDSYAGKFALAAFVGGIGPLAMFVIYLLLARSDWRDLYPLVAALVLACFAGFLGSLWLLRELLTPIDLTAEALRDYIDNRRLPDLPANFPDRAGKLMEGTQYTLTQLHETIDRLERVSDTDELTGVYNRRAGEKRLAEEVARAERSLEPFQIVFIDINDFKDTNDRHGHMAGDACIEHLARLLQDNTRHTDWVARWGGDEFIVGLHRNRALRMVVDRIVKAITSTRVEVAAGLELSLSVSAGVAEYRFGSGPAGVVADADKAMYAAKMEAHADGRSHVCYHSELPEATPAGERAAG
ncbi:MAG TPA: GGDEF domain-containing protein [Usitatibacter sp.]|nr:GGDEF domain-containing protein [Usitatibacter sp.]